MSYRSILVQAEATAASDTRIRLAASIARLFDGSLVGVGTEAFEPPIISEFAYMDADLYQTLRDQISERLKEAEQRFRDLCREEKVEAVWISEIDYPNRVLTLHARRCDLIVATRYVSPILRAQTSPADLIMESGLPVLVAPPEIAVGDWSYVMIAWKDSRECRRAISDSLPMLKRAKRVFLVHVNEGRAGESPEVALNEVSLRLKRHGVTIDHEIVPVTRSSIADRLIDAASRHGADLVISGAYGHSRLREWALGGVTRDLIDYSSKCVLFSH